ncbi:MAG: hypothetical protein ABJD07_17490 [Gemmatimonadaceae bacterium]
MRLADFVARYPGGGLGAPSDNARILDFFDNAPMATSSFAVRYRRAPNFFALLEHQAERAHVFLSVGDDGAVRTVGSVSLRPGWIDGRATTVGYLGDLRVGFDRRVIAQWRRFYAELLAHAHEIDELADCTHWYTAILDDNRAARLALGRERADAPAYVPLARFRMRNLVARLPLAGTSSRSRRVRRAMPSDAPRIAAFFDAANSGLAFGFRDELARRLSTWRGLAIDDFIFVEEGEEIVACVAPWSAAAVKETVVSRVPPALRAAGGVMRAMPRAPLRVPRAGEALRMLYLTHLAFAAHTTADARRRDVAAMLGVVFDQWRDAPWHCAALCDFDAWRLGDALRGYVQQTVPITVYAVVPPKMPRAAARAMGAGRPPAFEMAMV